VFSKVPWQQTAFDEALLGVSTVRSLDRSCVDGSPEVFRSLTGLGSRKGFRQFGAASGKIDGRLSLLI
jgi:hypothetical protein